MWTIRKNPVRVTDAWGASYRGRKEGPNQDRILLGTKITGAGQLFSNGQMPLAMAVADGISGDPGGDIAAQAALEALNSSGFPDSAAKAVERMETANQRIHEEAARWPAPMRDMCTTISAAWIFAGRIVLCARGDTPIYLIGRRRTALISKAHADRFGRLTSYLGADARVSVQTTWTQVLESSLGSIRGLVIMSDGISKFVPPRVLADTLAQSGAAPSSIGMRLLRTAWQEGSRDNMSFVMARFDAH